MFVASLPSWNQLIDLYHVVMDVAGATFQDTFIAQVYTGPKRFQPDFEDAPTLNMLLYPDDTSPVLHGNLIPGRIVQESPMDVIVFPWPHSPYNDGLMYMHVSVTGPRYHGFPNHHCAASISMLTWENKLLWFNTAPTPPVRRAAVSWTGPVNDGCADCDSMDLIFILDTPTALGAQTAEFPFACAGSGNVRWVWGYDGVTLFANLQDLVSGNPTVQWELVTTTWDGTTPEVLARVGAGDPPGMCGWPLTITLTPG